MTDLCFSLPLTGRYLVTYSMPLAKLLILAFSFLLTFSSFVTCSVNAQQPSKIVVATWNLEWFFDDYQGDNRSDLAKQQSAPSQSAWNWKKKAVADVIAEIKPSILCLQEVENRAVIYQLINQLEEDHKIKYRYAFIGGYDFGTEQDVAIMYRTGLVEYSRREQTSEMFKSNQYYNLSKHLIARFQWGSGEDKEELTILNCHLRARSERRDLRIRQTRLIHEWLHEQVEAGQNVIATGDFNTEDDFGAESDDGPVKIVRGLTNRDPADDLWDANEQIPDGERMTHISGRQYDRLFFSKPLAVDDPKRRDLVFNKAYVRKDLVIRGQFDGKQHWDGYWDLSDAERDISDHYPLVVEFDLK